MTLEELQAAFDKLQQEKNDLDNQYASLRTSYDSNVAELNNTKRRAHVYEEVGKKHNIGFDINTIDITKIDIGADGAMTGFEYTPPNVTTTQTQTSKSTPPTNTADSGLTADKINQMSPDEVMSNWDKIKNFAKTNTGSKDKLGVA